MAPFLFFRQVPTGPVLRRALVLTRRLQTGLVEGLQVFRGSLAIAAGNQFELNLLALAQAIQASTLNR